VGTNPKGPKTLQLVIGDDWPFPIPLAKDERTRALALRQTRTSPMAAGSS